MTNKKISDLNVKELAQAMKLYPVKSLDLTGNLITDDGLKFLIKPIKEAGLEKINLAKNKVGEKLIDSIISNLKLCKCMK